VPYKDPDIAKEYKRKWNQSHGTAYHRERYHARKNDPEFKRIKWAAKIYTLYRLREADYQALLNTQDSKCAICHIEFTDSPCIDHDHETGKVRGLLCWNCNVGIGSLKDDPKILQSAIDYLVYNDKDEKRFLSFGG